VAKTAAVKAVDSTVPALVSKALASIVSKEERHEAIKAKIDHFGALKAAISPLEAQAKKLGDELKEALPAGTTAGTLFEVLITKAPSRVVSSAKFIKKKGQALFNKLAKLSIKSLEDVMGKVEIDEITEDGEDTVSIRAKAIKQVVV